MIRYSSLKYISTSTRLYQKPPTSTRHKSIKKLVQKEQKRRKYVEKIQVKKDNTFSLLELNKSKLNYFEIELYVYLNLIKSLKYDNLQNIYIVEIIRKHDSFSILNQNATSTEKFRLKKSEITYHDNLSNLTGNSIPRTVITIKTLYDWLIYFQLFIINNSQRWLSKKLFKTSESTLTRFGNEINLNKVQVYNIPKTVPNGINCGNLVIPISAYNIDRKNCQEYFSDVIEAKPPKSS